MNRKEYNGWTNYETWAVNLWMSNEQGSSEYWASVADEISSPDSPEYIADADTQKHTLADRLKDEHEEALPELQGFASDLLRAAFSEVDWREIAESLLSTAAENRKV